MRFYSRLFVVGCTAVLGTVALVTGQDSTFEQVNPEKLGRTVIDKAGLGLGGSFRSEILRSQLRTERVGPLPSTENVAATTLDLDLSARAHEAATGRILLRVHQDWRQTFSELGNTIFVRWMSIDGRVLDMFGYSAGDFKQRYSPYTLWTPEVDIMYEPEIFARDRQRSQGERFVGDSTRQFQGLNMVFDGAVGSILPEVHSGLFGARLRHPKMDNSSLVPVTQQSSYEKYSTGANTDLFVAPMFKVGGSALAVFDIKQPLVDKNRDFDTIAEGLRVFDGRARLDLHNLLDTSRVRLSVSGEWAMSRLDDNYLTAVTDTIGGTFRESYTLHKQTIDGSAMQAGFEAAFKIPNVFGIQLNGRYISNDPNFHNDLAQSPAFRPRPIMNVESDTGWIKSYPYSWPISLQERPFSQALYYTSFDALYRTVFRFHQNGKANNPMSKNAYTNAIYTPSELGLIQTAGLLDPALQLTMPFGQSTPNRQGIRADCTLDVLGDKIEMRGVLDILEEREGITIDSVRVLPQSDLSRLGGGLRLRFDRMFSLPYPLDLSGSLIRSSWTNNRVPGDTLFASSSIISDFVNAGAYWKFWRRAAVLAGTQLIHNVYAISDTTASDEVETNISAGIEYELSRTARALLRFTRVALDSKAGLRNDFGQNQIHFIVDVNF